MTKALSFFFILLAMPSIAFAAPPVGSALPPGSIIPAPLSATYIVRLSDPLLTNEQALSSLITGILKNTGGTGVITIAVAGVDYLSPNATTTVTNMTISLGANPVTGTLSQFNTACTDCDFVSIAGTETVSNKTLASPRVTGAISTNTDGTVPIGTSSARFSDFRVRQIIVD